MTHLNTAGIVGVSNIPAVIDSSNATFTVVARDANYVTELLGFLISANNADNFTVRLGSQIVTKLYGGANYSGISQLWPFAVTGREETANLTGTVSILDDDVTFTANAVTDVITLSATTGIVAGHPLVFKSSGTLPAGLVAGTTYYYGLSSGKLYSTQADAITDDGTTNKIDITDAGTGTHSLDGTYVHGSATTTFTTDFAGFDIAVLGGNAFTVSSVISATKLTLTAANTANSASGLTYKRGADPLTVTKGTANTAVSFTPFYNQLRVF